jgi:hypothetical protein
MTDWLQPVSIKAIIILPPIHTGSNGSPLYIIILQ